jgi:hypothetical protein
MASLLSVWLWLRRKSRPGAPAPPSPEETAAVVAQIKAEGGYAVTDDGLPGRPVVELELSQRTTYDLARVNAVLPRLAGLTQLRTLTLGGAPLKQTGMAALAAFVRLKCLNLGACPQVTDAGLVFLSGLRELETLNLGATAVTNAGLKYLGSLTSLRMLALYRTRITDAGLVHLKDLPHLRTLNVSHTQVTEAGVEALRQANPALQVER